MASDGLRPIRQHSWLILAIVVKILNTFLYYLPYVNCMDEQIPEQQPEPWWKGPIKYIIGTFLLLIIIMWTFAVYGGKIDPEPQRIPTSAEVLPQLDLTNITKLADFTLMPTDAVIKQTADRIVSISCEGNRVCYAKALYYFVRDNYQYVNDPVNNEYYMHPYEFLSVGVGDCDDGTISLAVLLEAVGIRTEFVFMPQHVFLKAYLPEAAKGYRMGDYVYLDWTCGNCKFGELPLEDRRYV